MKELLVATPTRRMTGGQEQVMRNNFEQNGAFYLSRDLHAMLDCACAPECALASEAETSANLDIPLGVKFNAKLREEFFGGILFDCDKHRHYMVNHEGYGLLKNIVESRPTGRELLKNSGGVANASQSLNSLLQSGVIGEFSGTKTVRQFLARELSVEYLQAPSIVEVEVTYGCFRSCRHCAYESSPDAQMPNELSANQWSAIFTKLADAGVLILQLTGGDPLYRDDSFEIIERADEAGLSVYVRSDTVALSKSNVDRLKAVRGLWHVGTSIDGADAEMHDWMRGSGAFDVFRERLGVLASNGIPVAAGATLHKNNFKTVREIGKRVAEFGANWFDIGFLSPVGRGANLRDLVLDENEIAESLASYLDGVRAGDYVPSHAHYLRRAHSDRPFDDITPLLGKLPYVTEWPFNRLRLDPTGSAYTAGKLKGSDYAAGFNLLDNSVEHIWDDSPNLQALRELGRGERIHSLDYRSLTSSHLFD